MAANHKIVQFFYFITKSTQIRRISDRVDSMQEGYMIATILQQAPSQSKCFKVQLKEPKMTLEERVQLQTWLDSNRKLKSLVYNHRHILIPEATQRTKRNVRHSSGNLLWTSQNSPARKWRTGRNNNRRPPTQTTQFGEDKNTPRSSA